MTTIWEAYAEALGETPEPFGAGRRRGGRRAGPRRRRSLRPSGPTGGSVPVTRRPGRHAVLPLAGASRCREGLG